MIHLRFVRGSIASKRVRKIDFAAVADKRECNLRFVLNLVISLTTSDRAKVLLLRVSVPRTTLIPSVRGHRVSPDLLGGGLFNLWPRYRLDPCQFAISLSPTQHLFRR